MRIDLKNSATPSGIIIFLLQGSQRIRKRKERRQFIGRNIHQKLPESGEGNRNADPGGTESPQQNQPKEVHTKTYSR